MGGREAGTQARTCSHAQAGAGRLPAPGRGRAWPVVGRGHPAPAPALRGGCRGQHRQVRCTPACARERRGAGAGLEADPRSCIWQCRQRPRQQRQQQQQPSSSPSPSRGTHLRHCCASQNSTAAQCRCCSGAAPVALPGPDSARPAAARPGTQAHRWLRRRGGSAGMPEATPLSASPPAWLGFALKRLACSPYCSP